MLKNVIVTIFINKKCIPFAFKTSFVKIIYNLFEKETVLINGVCVSISRDKQFIHPF